MINYKTRNIIVVLVLMFSGLFAGLVSSSTEPVTKSDTTAAATENQPEDPIKLLRGVTTNVLKALKDNQERLENKSKGIYDVVDKYIIPYVDFNEMSTWVAGRTAWGKASEKSRDRFVAAFKILVVRTYATSLNNYANETVDFAKQKVDTSKERIQISSHIIRQGKESIRLDYRLIKHENTWLVYDVIIEGVSILQGFQAQFSDEIRHDGLEKVIAKIEEHNKKGDVA